jgi:hypothetical protein
VMFKGTDSDFCGPFRVRHWYLLRPCGAAAPALLHES